MPWIEQQFAGSPGPAGGGLTDAQIFNAGPISTRTVADINFQGNAIAAPRTVRWSSTINFINAGDYEFAIYVKDGMRFFIDGNLIRSEWRTHQSATSYMTRMPMPVGPRNIVVEYFNDNGNGTAVFEIRPVNSSTTPPVSTPPTSSAPPPVTPPPTTTPPTSSAPPPVTPPPVVPPPPPVIDLMGFIRFSNNSVTRDYVKQSLVAPSSHNITVTNISTTIDVSVAFATVPAITITPASFPLPKNSSRNVVFTFNPIQLENFQDGVTTVNIIATAAATNAPVIINTTPIIPTVSSSVTPNLPPSTPLVITPEVAAIEQGQSATFRATRGGLPVAVNWSIQPQSAQRIATITTPTASPSTSVTVFAANTGTAFVVATVGSEIVQSNFVVSPVSVPSGDPIIPPFPPDRPPIIPVPIIPEIPPTLIPVTPPQGPILFPTGVLPITNNPTVPGSTGGTPPTGEESALEPDTVTFTLNSLSNN